MKGIRTLSAVLSVLVMGCSSGTWVDLAAYGAPRNCKDLDGKSKGLELSGAQIVLRGNVKDGAQLLCPRHLFQRREGVDVRRPLRGHGRPSEVQVEDGQHPSGPLTGPGAVQQQLTLACVACE